MLKKKTKAQRVLGCTALLPYCIFFSFFFFSTMVFFPLSQSCCQDEDVTPQTGTTKRAKREEKKKKKMLSASRGSNRWDVKQKQRKKGTLSAELWNTETTFMVEGKRKHRLAQLFCCVRTRFFSFFLFFFGGSSSGEK